MYKAQIHQPIASSALGNWLNSWLNDFVTSYVIFQFYVGIIWQFWVAGWARFRMNSSDLRHCCITVVWNYRRKTAI